MQNPALKNECRNGFVDVTSRHAVLDSVMCCGRNLASFSLYSNPMSRC